MSTRRIPLVRTALLTLLLGVSATLSGQNATGRIVGTVTDPQGALVAGAQVRVIDLATSVATPTVTNSDGYFDVRALPIGTYKVSVEHPGFSTAETQEKRLQINESIRFDITLAVGTAQQTVTVEARVSGVETVNATLSQSVVGEAVKDLPLNGRNVLDLAKLQPGVTEANPGARGQGFSISGNRTDAVEFLLDGGLNTNLMNNSVVLNPNPDAVEEFRILSSNYSAEYGRNAGGVISVVTKSGTNRYHGSAFDFVRNDALNANSFFNKLGGVPRDVLKRHQFGGTFGGPITIPHVVDGKDKAFFFLSYQGQRQTQAVSATQVSTFSTAELGGDFSKSGGGGTPDPKVASFLQAHTYFQSNPALAAQAIIDVTKIDPVAAKYIGLKLIPTVANSSGTVSTADNSKDNYNELSLKTDYSISEKDKLTFTLGQHKEKLVLPYGDGNANVKGFTDLGTLKNYFGSIGYNRTISATLLNELRFTAQRRELGQDIPGNALPSPQSLGFSITPDIAAGPPQLLFGGSGLSLGFNGNGPTNFADTTFNYSDTVSWAKGKNTLRLGGDFWTFADNFAFGYVTSGSFFYTSGGGQSSGNEFADFLLGNPEFYTQGPNGPNNVRTRATAVFGQDEWRVRSNLTLSFGLRYEYNTPKRDSFGRTVTIIPGLQSTRFANAPLSLVGPGDKGAPVGVFFPDKNNFAPRIGFAWDPWSDHKTSVRGGGGVFYDVLNGADAVDQNGAPPFASFAAFPFDGFPFPGGNTPPPLHYSDPFGSVGRISPFPIKPLTPNLDWIAAGYLPWGATVTDPHQRTPYVYQYNVSVQREVAKSLIAEVSYVGSSSKKLQTVRQFNPMILGTSNRLLNVNQTNPAIISFCNSNGGVGACPFGGFSGYTDRGFASYNSLQSSLTKQAGETKLGSAYFTLAYTYGHSIDNTSGKGNRSQTVPYYDNHVFRASSDFNALHTVSFGGGWDLPFDKAWTSGPKALLKGWSLFPIFSWHTGFPLNVGTRFSSGIGDPGSSGAGDVGAENAWLDRSKLQYRMPTPSNLSFFAPGAFSNAQYSSGSCPTEIPIATSGLFPTGDCTPGNPSLRTYGGPRNALRGPGRTNLDLSLAKTTKIHENFNAQLRFEAFNLFNHTEFSSVSTNISSSKFGQVTDTYRPRILQIALRLSF